MTMTSSRTSSHVARPIEQLVSEIAELHSQFDATAAESEEIGDAPPALVDLMRQIRVPMIKAPLEAGGDRPIDREEADDRPQDQHAVNRNPAGPPFGAKAAVGV